MKNKILIGIGVVFIFVIGIYLAIPPRNYLGGGFTTTSAVTQTTSSISMAATSTVLVAGNPSMSFLEICNTQSNPAYLHLVGADANATTTGLVVGKGTVLDGFGNTTSTSYFCRDLSWYKGAITAIAVTTTTVIINKAN